MPEMTRDRSRRLTRFQRLNLTLGVVALVGLAAAASASKAQTFEDAVRANVALGLQLCIAGGNGIDAWLQSFRNAGFAERIEQSGGDTTHYFTAPAGTAEIELYYGQLPEHCHVSTQHLGVTAAGAVLDLVVPAIYPNFTRRIVTGAVDPATGQPAQCVRYEDPLNPIGLQVGVVDAASQYGECQENGTSLFFSSYRV